VIQNCIPIEELNQTHKMLLKPKVSDGRSQSLHPAFFVLCTECKTPKDVYIWRSIVCLIALATLHSPCKYFFLFSFLYSSNLMWPFLETPIYN